MTEADVPAVAEVHVRCWQFAYAGLIPQSHLDGMDVTAHTERTRARFRTGDSAVENLVAEDAAGTVTGWASLGPYRDDEGTGGGLEHDGELYAIYLRPDHLGQGVGRALMDVVMERATARGFPRLRLWVLAGNDRARRFYERAGFAADGGAEPFTIAGVDVPEVRYARRMNPA